ncbi:MAG: leucine-rich repeat protein [Paludibacteraceae bacterium]|nr:leucine-rich repeat protein [Paludibacteraceae bacterium]
MERPNVSYCVGDNEVHYNPILPTETRVVGTFNVTSTSQPTWMTYTGGWNNVSKVEITKPSGTTIELTFSDLTTDDGDGYGYTFDETGVHTIYYTLINQTFIGFDFAQSFYSLASITIPNSVTSIDGDAFGSCSGLTTVTIGTGVTTLGSSVTPFMMCNNIVNVTIKATTPPTYGSTYESIFYSSHPHIYVPADSVAAYKAASGWSTYANDIEAIPTT